MPQVNQARGQLERHLLVVDVEIIDGERTATLGRRLVAHHRDVCPKDAAQFARRGDEEHPDDAGDAAVEAEAQAAAFGTAQPIGAECDHVVASRLHHLLHGADQRRIERVGQVRHDAGDHHRAVGLERLRHAVGHIVQRRRTLADPLLHTRADAAPVARQHRRHRRLRHPGMGGHIFLRRLAFGRFHLETCGLIRISSHISMETEPSRQAGANRG